MNSTKPTLTNEQNKKQNKFFKAITSWFKKRVIPAHNALWNKPLLYCLCLATLFNLFLEILGRHSLIEGFAFIFKGFHIFVFGVIFITLTLSVSLFFKRRRFVLLIVSAIWLALGVANSVALSYRPTPFIAIDFLNMKAAMGVSSVYITIPMLIAVGLGVITVIGVLIYLYRNVKHENVNFKRSGIIFLCLLVLSVGCGLAFDLFGTIDKSLNLPDRYNKYGYVCCFSASVVDYGAERPDNYSKEQIGEIKEIINTVPESVPEELPNIIVIQLESFFDVNELVGVQFSENPIPFFTELTENFQSGYLNVPALGASTANVEFELLTGMDVHDFGFDEYPYITFLDDQPVESLAHTLGELDYTSFAIHNHSGNFYNRNIAYTNLGFNVFVPLECMTDAEFTEYGWAKDKVLGKEILGALNSTDGKDFVFTVTAQGHGKYPSEKMPVDHEITVQGIEDEEFKHQLEYYSSQLYETDLFLKELVSAIKERDEKTVLVAYGDHLPTLIDESEALKYGNKYQTKYVIWSNYELQGESTDQELSAHTLGAELLSDIGISVGNITRLHQAKPENKAELLKALEYDMVDGNRYIFDGKHRYKATEMRFGLENTEIHFIELNDSALYVSGKNFTKDSVIYIDGARCSTDYINSTLLKTNDVDEILNGQDIVIKQMTFDLVTLAESEPFVTSGYAKDVTQFKKNINKYVAPVSYAFIVVFSAILVFFIVKYVKARKNKSALHTDQAENET